MLHSPIGQHTKTIFFKDSQTQTEVLSFLFSELLPSGSACSAKRSTMPGTLISAREQGAPHLGEHLCLLGYWLLRFPFLVPQRL